LGHRIRRKLKLKSGNDVRRICGLEAPWLGLENVGFKYRAQYKQNPKQDRQWSEYHSAPPVLIEQMAVSERGKAKAYRGHTKGNERQCGSAVALGQG